MFICTLRVCVCAAQHFIRLGFIACILYEKHRPALPHPHRARRLLPLLHSQRRRRDVSFGRAELQAASAVPLLPVVALHAQRLAALGVGHGRWNRRPHWKSNRRHRQLPHERCHVALHLQEQNKKRNVAKGGGVQSQIKAKVILFFCLTYHQINHQSNSTTQGRDTVHSCRSFLLGFLIRCKALPSSCAGRADLRELQVGSRPAGGATDKWPHMTWRKLLHRQCRG